LKIYGKITQQINIRVLRTGNAIILTNARFELALHWRKVGMTSLALDRTRLPGVRATQKIIPGAGFNKRINGKKGIIFLKDYWARSGQTTNPTGDHIDLWNGSRLTALTSYFRVRWGITWDGEWSDYHRSKEVWFWEVL